MCPANRNRPDYRSIAFCIVIALITIAVFALPASAGNIAVYYVSEDGTDLSANIIMTDQERFYLVTPGIFGTDEVLKVDDLSILDSEGNEAKYTQNGYILSFEKGNYTLSYNVKIENNLVYVKYPENYYVTVHIPEPFTTGNLILGTASRGGVISHHTTQDGITYTDVGYDETKAFSITFYNNNRPFALYLFLGVWAVVLLIFVARHIRIKKRLKRINE